MDFWGTFFFHSPDPDERRLRFVMKLRIRVWLFRLSNNVDGVELDLHTPAQHEKHCHCVVSNVWTRKSLTWPVSKLGATRSASRKFILVSSQYWIVPGPLGMTSELRTRTNGLATDPMFEQTLLNKMDPSVRHKLFLSFFFFFFIFKSIRPDSTFRFYPMVNDWMGILTCTKGHVMHARLCTCVITLSTGFCQPSKSEFSKENHTWAKTTN